MKEKTIIFEEAFPPPNTVAKSQSKKDYALVTKIGWLKNKVLSCGEVVLCIDGIFYNHNIQPRVVTRNKQNHILPSKSQTTNQYKVYKAWLHERFKQKQVYVRTS